MSLLVGCRLGGSTSQCLLDSRACYGYSSVRHIAVIPARGGSKRVPGKNVRPFRGRPMIEWAIDAALMSSLFIDVVVSTDDEGIAEIARAVGASVPFVRPTDLADDLTPLVPVVAQAISAMSGFHADVEGVCCIYATAPFVRPGDLAAGLDRLIVSACDYVVSAVEFPAPVKRGFLMGDSNEISMLFPDEYATRSQDLAPVYHDAGQWCWGTKASWLAGLPMLGPNSTAHVLPSWRVCDIDTEEDWVRAELIGEYLSD